MVSMEPVMAAAARASSGRPSEMTMVWRGGHPSMKRKPPARSVLPIRGSLRPGPVPRGSPGAAEDQRRRDRRDRNLGNADRSLSTARRRVQRILYDNPEYRSYFVAPRIVSAARFPLHNHRRPLAVRSKSKSVPLKLALHRRGFSRGLNALNDDVRFPDSQQRQRKFHLPTRGY